MILSQGCFEREMKAKNAANVLMYNLLDFCFAGCAADGVPLEALGLNG